jgi:hypothetical protein
MTSTLKVVRDNKVAVCYSPGYGAGWSTWNKECAETLIFHPKIVEWIERGKITRIDSVIEELCLDIYTGGADALIIMWLPKGTRFYVDECDGHEDIITNERLFMIA